MRPTALRPHWKSRLTSLSLGTAVLGVLLASSGVAHADPTLREQFDLKGDFTMFGNSAGYECGNDELPPVVGAVTCPNPNGDNQSDTSVDLFWRSEDPGAGQATANGTITLNQARTTAVLGLPSGATIRYARIYWAGLVDQGDGADSSISLARPDGSFDETVTADDTFTVDRGGNGNDNIWYQSTADITDLLVEHGTGAYRASGLASIDIRNLDNEDPMLAWVVVVIYERDGDPPRNLAIFDGLDLVQDNAPADVSISGFLVPQAGFDAKLGVIAYEGEDSLEGDSLEFNGTALSDAVNPVDNFFNSSRSNLGVPVTVVGDLPQLSGAPNSMSGVDFDIVDVKAELMSGDTSATISATSTSDRYLLGAFVTSISTFKPDFQSSNKTFVDVNGGTVQQGDVLEYTIVATNDGNDTAVNTVMTDELPDGLEYVEGTLEITDGANSGAKTDADGDDQAEFDAGTNTITVRLGDGADDAQGGTMEVGESSTVTFRARVRQGTTGSIFNQAVITAEGELGAPSSDYPTDGNGNGAGAPPTETVVGECSGSACDEDSDGDGISDDDEADLGTDPNDADSDDDGASDGEELEPGEDSDDDGIPNALDPDSDNDGLWDGTELGFGCDGPGTNLANGNCRPDADGGDTTTDPLDADTDDGGVSDGAEDSNQNGRIDDDELDPNDPEDDDDATDRDGDGLSDGQETAIGSDPNDADSDDDGAPDGEEQNPADDTDGDGLINVLDPDSDNDGLWDGTELGFDCDGDDTDTDAKHCRADADMGDTVTNPLDPDTDDGGVKDGAEDFNLDGKIDEGEGDPNDESDDDDIVDTDGDGLSDGQEMTIGSDPNDADSDDDGAPDGDEANPADDTDGDGLINVLDPDSDNDGLFDGTELGFGCDAEGTAEDSDTCIADADDGDTTTSPLDPDTDDGGVNDGDEDANHNGRVDDGERDPNDASDDDGGIGAGGAGGAAGGIVDGSLEGGGCSCRTAQGESNSMGLGLVGLGLAAGLALRRRTRTRTA